MKQKRNKLFYEEGFTLIELLVVIVIIGILSAGAFAMFTRTQTQARDAVRKNDLVILEHAIEIYKATPPDHNPPIPQGEAPPIGADYSEFKNSLDQFMEAMPLDPGIYSYGYYRDPNKQLYKLYGYQESGTPADPLGIVFGNAAVTPGDATCTDGLDASPTTGKCDSDTGRKFGCKNPGWVEDCVQ